MKVLISRMRDERCTEWLKQRRAERMISELYFTMKAITAAAYFSAPFIPDSTVVIDAIGEFDTASIWVDGVKVWNKTYPWSLGLFYSAITKRIGLKPNEDEYITMGMAAYGDIRIDMTKEIHQNHHRGIKKRQWFWHTPEDIAASAQAQLESELLDIFALARKLRSQRGLCWWSCTELCSK